MRAAIIALMMLATSLAFWARSARAADSDFGPFHLDQSSPEVIHLRGPISPNSGLDFQRALDAAPGAKILALDSPGGVVNIALLIAYSVHRRHLSTFVPSGSSCLSACALIFFAGVQHTVLGSLGVHQIYAAGVPDLNQAQVTISDIIDVLSRFGAPDAVLTIMFRTPPSQMHIFSAAEIVEYHINSSSPIPHNLSPPTASQSHIDSSSPARPASDQSRYSECAKFADDYFALWSSDNSAVFTKMPSFYASSVKFYGRSLKIQDLMDEKMKFARRWPMRQYKPRSSSLDIQIDNSGCSTTGIVDWTAKSQIQGKQSKGVAWFTFGLVDQGNLRISSEFGKVVSVVSTKLSMARGEASRATAVNLGEFPIASCKSWDGTVTLLKGKNSRRALMAGFVSRANVREFCERDPGGETVAYGGKESVDQCIEKNYRSVENLRLTATADCAADEVTLRSGSTAFRHVRLPVADTSCASGNPPIIAEFKLMCPARAHELGLN